MLTGEEKELSLEEKLRRERARQMNTGTSRNDSEIH
jgi:hypothetical protein